MRRVGNSRKHNVDLLVRVPRRDDSTDAGVSTLLIDAAGQFAALADLVDRGLVSPAEYERQRRKIFGS
jgi:hypothetical protein